MNSRDIPPRVFIESFLKAATDADIEATVVYTVDKNGKRKTSAASNKGPEGFARAVNALKFGDGAIERAAMALHAFRITFVPADGEPLPEDLQAEMAKCFICRESVSWDKLSEPDRHGHRELAKAAIAGAVTGVSATTEPLVKV